MKFLLSILVVVILFIISGKDAHAQVSNWSLVERAGGTEADLGGDISVDVAGNIYIIGTFNGTAIFGDSILTSEGQSDGYFAKFDAAGAFLWVKQFGGADFDAVNSVSVDVSGNSLITGSFRGSATIDDTTLTSAGGDDIFVAKYDAQGNRIWVQQAGGTEFFDEGHGIAIDGLDNILVSGAFQGTATFSDTTVTSAGFNDIFLAKYSSQGNLIWVQQAGGTRGDGSNSVAVDISGNCLVTGSFFNTATFNDTTLIGAGDNDIFVAKYNAQGNFVWVQQAGGIDLDRGLDIATDISANTFITGFFVGAATFDDTMLTSMGQSDGFFAKYDGGGNLLWVRQIGGSLSDAVQSVATDGSGNIYITGSFQETVTFDDTTLTSAGSADIFVAKYDSQGNLFWVQQAGGSVSDGGNSIVMNGSGTAFVTGSFSDTATFGDTTLTSAGNSDIFIAKIEEITTGIGASGKKPESIQLFPNFPNPFNPVTTIQYYLPKSTNVELKIYNILGQEVKTLVKARQPAGKQQLTWDGRDSFGKAVSSGIYIYQFRAGDFTKSRKMLLIR